MKVNLINEPFDFGEGYAVYTGYMGSMSDNIDIVKCPDNNMTKDKGRDSFLDFLYGEVSESEDFENFTTFMFIRVEFSTKVIEDNLVSILKRLYYPSSNPDHISTSHLKFSNGWEGYQFFNNNVCIINKEENEYKTNIFIALPGKININDTKCRWNDIVVKDNFYDILKSKMIEELINAQVYG